MVHLIANRKHPLRFLLYLEWVLLGVVICTEAFAPFIGLVSRLPRIPLLNLFCLLIFGLIGLKLPFNNRLNKIIYTGFEFVLIIIASMVGGILVVPLLYIVLIARNCLMFEGINRSIISALAVIFSLLTQLYRAKQINLVQPLAINQQLAVVLLVSVLTLGISAIFMHMAVNAILEEFQSRQKLSLQSEQLAVANAQLREYALRIEELAIVQERNRIARDIHDSVGHTLTVLNLHLEAAVKLWQTDLEEATDFLTEAKKLGSNALQDVRQSIATLQVDPLARLSLPEVLTNLVKEFQRSSNIFTVLEIDVTRQIKNEIQVAIYRIVQESLTNICKYSEATEVNINLYIKNHLLLIIRDNGKGFELSQNTTGFGLKNMKDRALAVGGSVEIETALNCGCKIIAIFPLD